ncbi:putative peptide/nitrate transporter [Cercospora beticola]|uniref:Putative peptide/nitrate transporter n=1 Tax=Cercospora beticola TaxID=122368 RepID=A0A2G5IBJ7_CERBT|nr:putative peptide/nitrate transporter [Cercospora beticola]PIB02082.1 putative peptide/nitrate transporter [Cercospora beticola]WPA97572.1 hypothetical protein RHO25_002182 [Cercospora beticola]
MAPSADPIKHDISVNAPSESTPLLGAPDSAPATADYATNGSANGHAQNGTKAAQEESNPMPYTQVIVLCYASLAEPVAYFAIFPFINEMLARNGDLPSESVGFWSGSIESLFSLVQMVLMIFYGRMADRIGRKPVLVFSLAGVSVATALFGMSRNLWQMIVLRCVAGLFAGTVVTIRTMLSEITTKETQGRAFSWYMFTRNLGIFVGPLLGGALANPAQQFPSTFGHSQFFIDYPYALPTFGAGLMCASSTIAALILLNETLKRDERSASKTSAPPMTTVEILRAPGVGLVLFILGHTMTLALGYTATSPVVMFEPVDKSGFNFTPAQISYFLATAGASQALWTLLVFPPLERSIGSKRILFYCSILWVFFMAAYPIGNELLRHGKDTVFWVFMWSVMVLGSSVSMAFAAVQLLINDISPSKEVLATVNALSLTVSSGVRAVAPALFTNITALGIRWGWADGHLVWFIFIALAALLIVVTRLLPDEDSNKAQDAKQANGLTSSRRPNDEAEA